MQEKEWIRHNEIKKHFKRRTYYNGDSSWQTGKSGCQREDDETNQMMRQKSGWSETGDRSREDRMDDDGKAG